MIKNLSEKIKKITGKTYKGNRNKRIVFILSTGRCGSTSITQMFNQHPLFHSIHEGIPDLIRLSTKFAENPRIKNEIFKELNGIFQNRIWEGNNKQVIVHSDHRLWNFVEYLNSYFPNSFFIHLIRNPHDSVKSYLPREWYTLNDNSLNNNEHSKYRLQGDKIGVYKKNEWVDLTQMEKCIWYWDFVNTSIIQQLREIPDNRKITLKLESLEEGMNNKVKIKFGLNDDFYFRDVKSNVGIKKLIDDKFDKEYTKLKLKFSESEAFRLYKD